jgi:hypothetical protein
LPDYAWKVRERAGWLYETLAAHSLASVARLADLGAVSAMCLQLIMPPLAFCVASLMFLCCPHPAKPILLIFGWNHGLRAVWWLLLGPMPFLLFYMGMSFTLIPCFGKKPHLWSPTGGALIGNCIACVWRPRSPCPSYRPHLIGPNV